MSGRPTTCRSTNWSRLLLVFAVVAAIALPSVAGRFGLRSALDSDRAVSAAASKAIDEAVTTATTVRAERPLAVVLTMVAPVIGLLALRRRPIDVSSAMASSALVPGGVGLRAPPLRSRP